MDWSTFESWATEAEAQALFIGVVSILAAHLFNWTVGALAVRLAKKTSNDVDDQIVEALRSPVKHTIMIVGIWTAIHHLSPPEILDFVTSGLLGTWATAVWISAMFRITQLIGKELSIHPERFHAVNSRTLPVFEMGAKTVVAGAGLYFVFLAWQIDVTGWLASAGILGVVLGFGAKDTVADLFAGIFILADAPYKRGDYLLLSSGERGRVTKIGMRTTRMLTADEVEIIIPNAQMATSMISNESGGPREMERVNVDFNVAYGSDVDQVRSVLLEVAGEIPEVLNDDSLHTSSVYFSSMEDSGMAFQLRVWISRPELRLSVIDAMNERIYKRLQAEGIEIPYPKRDVYLHRDED